MDFSLTGAQAEVREATRRFASERLGTGLRADAAGESPCDAWREDWQACAEHGIFSDFAPKDYGGTGQDVMSVVLMLEALGHGCPDNGLTLAVNGQIWALMEPLIAFGTEAHKRRYLPGLCDGSIVGAHGMTERDTGSDAFALATRADRRDGGFVLNGDKTLIGLGPACDLALVFATSDPALGRWGVSAFLVEASDAGFERGPAETKMGLNTTPLGDLSLRDCWIPEDRVLGDEGSGAALFSHTMEWERSFIFASHVGSMARQLDACTAHAHRRRVFGVPIEQHQSVANRLADMALRLETSRLLLYKAAWLKSRGEPCALEAAMTKLHISEAFVASSLDAIRIHGGAGYLAATGIEHDLRDAVGGIIYSGTSDIQRQIIASLLRTQA